MKLFTYSEQTSKLVELGCKKPLGWVTNNFEYASGNYSLGELIEMLPTSLCFDDGDWTLCMESDVYAIADKWVVSYSPSFRTEETELIDAVFEMVVKLKREENNDRH